QREADAEAALAAVERALALHEKLEHPRQELRLDAAAVVLDGDGGLAFAARRGEADLPALRRVLRGVVEQVGQHLREAREVAHQPYRVRAHLEREPLLALV